MKRILTGHKELWIIGIAFLIVYILNVGSLKFARDDWCTLNYFNELLESRGFTSTFFYIANNGWLSVMYIPRVFFVSWWIQFLGLNIFGFNHIPYYIFILSIHFVSAVLVYFIIFKITKNNFLSLVVSLFFLTSPTSTNVLFWLNNWFFSIPVFFFLLYITIYLNRIKNTFLDYLSLLIIFILCQFSGEQIIPMLYTFAAITVFMAIRTYVKKQDKRGILRSIIVIAQ